MGSGPGLRRTVLVVDDDPQVRALAARILADSGFAVLEAADAIHGLALLEDPVAADVCLVVTDVLMPGLTGDELGRLLHHLRPTLPVLYMSAYSRPHLDFLSPDEQEHCWLEKPFSPSALVDRALQLCDPAQSPP